MLSKHKTPDVVTSEPAHNSIHFAICIQCTPGENAASENQVKRLQIGSGRSAVSTFGRRIQDYWPPDQFGISPKVHPI
jgi:hypothetical protein